MIKTFRTADMSGNAVAKFKDLMPLLTFDYKAISSHVMCYITHTHTHLF